jgi:hypothetical protein
MTNYVYPVIPCEGRESPSSDVAKLCYKGFIGTWRSSAYAEDDSLLALV